VIPDDHQSNWHLITRALPLEAWPKDLPAAVLSRRENFPATFRSELSANFVPHSSHGAVTGIAFQPAIAVNLQPVAGDGGLNKTLQTPSIQGCFLFAREDPGSSIGLGDEAVRPGQQHQNAFARLL